MFFNRSFENFSIVLCTILFLMLYIKSSTANMPQSFNNTQNNNYVDSNRMVEPRSLLADMARELVSSGGTSSQVLSLNLTNLIILLILKGILFGTAMIGSGSWKGRSVEENIYENIFNRNDSVQINESELLLFLSYLMGESTKNYECLKRVACSDTKKSTQYLLAARMFIGSSKLLFKEAIPINKKYEDLIAELQNAIYFGKEGGRCEEKYSCTNENEIK